MSIRAKIEEIIDKEFSNSRHAVVEEENIIAIVKTDYKKMAHAVAGKILEALRSSLPKKQEEVPFYRDEHDFNRGFNTALEEVEDVLK